MSFANPWGLLGLLAIPAILIIHLYHRRFPPLLIAGAHLWGVQTEVRTAGRRRDRLPITATLILELLAALLLTFVLSQPRFGRLGTVTHLVAVLDNSASMSAVPAGGESIRDAAVKALEERVAALDRGSVVTLILTGRRPAMLAGPAVSWEAAKAALAGWKPQATQHEFYPAWDLASQLSEGAGPLLFLTDRVPPEDVALPRRMEAIAVGRALNNLAITSARWTFDSTANEGKVFLRVENRGSRAAQAVVRGTAKGQSVFRNESAIPPGGSIPLETSVPGGLGELKVEVASAGDPLAVDNTVTLIEPKVRMVTIALTLPSDDPAARATRRVLETIPDVQFGAVEDAHLIIGPAGTLPPSRRDLWWLGIGPIDRSDAAREKATHLSDRQPYLIEKRNPLLEGVLLGGVFWGGVQKTDLNVTPLISAETSQIWPLLSQLGGTQTTAYLLNIDFARSNLSESPDWPILLSNLVELRREALPGLRQWNYRLNEEIRFRLFEGDSESSSAGGELTLVSQGRTRPLVRGSVVEVPPLDETGVYEIREGDRTLDRFAVNFHDPAESTLVALDAGTRPPVAPPETAAFWIDNPYSWVVLLGVLLILAAVLCDWYVLKPARNPT